jgi:hypothetical protein
MCLLNGWFGNRSEKYTVIPELDNASVGKRDKKLRVPRSFSKHLKKHPGR